MKLGVKRSPRYLRELRAPMCVGFLKLRYREITKLRDNDDLSQEYNRKNENTVNVTQLREEFYILLKITYTQTV